MARKTTEELIDEYDTTTNPVTESVLRSIIKEHLEDSQDFRDFEKKQPKDYEEK